MKWWDVIGNTVIPRRLGRRAEQTYWTTPSQSGIIPFQYTASIQERLVHLQVLKNPLDLISRAEQQQYNGAKPIPVDPRRRRRSEWMARRDAATSAVISVTMRLSAADRAKRTNESRAPIQAPALYKFGALTRRCSRLSIGSVAVHCVPGCRGRYYYYASIHPHNTSYRNTFCDFHFTFHKRRVYTYRVFPTCCWLLIQFFYSALYSLTAHYAINQRLFI